MDIKGRVALVTGASRGIGRATALGFASMGASVLVNYAHDRASAEKVASELERKGVEALAVGADISNLSEAERLVNAAVERFGRLDILVCNAGVWEGAPVEEMSEELWDRVIEINLKGTWAVCRAATPLMKREKFGRIVIVSSTAGQRGEAGFSNYAASKGGQISFTKSLAAELAPYGINVNAVAPGWVDTQLCAGVLEDLNSRRTVEETIPLGRVAQAEDVAWPIIFLCSSWARHITGEVLNVNGGSVLCG
ncbi:MAG: SDR family NAD(P)-dependent oxidoreductase [Pyrinomonadaceae bacterium]